MTLSRGSAGLLGAVVLAGCTASRAPELPVPTPDGRVEEAEWRAARRIPLGERGALRLVQGGGTLHLALEAGADGIASVFLFDGARVHVLHASAALGTAVFLRGAEGRWQREQDFTWGARDPGDAAARSAFRRANGWLANVARGGADREFVIDLTHFEGQGPLRLAAGYLHVGPGAMTVDAWPAEARDAPADVRLHQGDTGTGPVFAPEQWLAVEP